MQENTKVSPIILVLKKAWPYIYRVINSSIYFIATVIRSIFKGIIEQIKGM
jgi:hypothetical protein